MVGIRTKVLKSVGRNWEPNWQTNALRRGSRTGEARAQASRKGYAQALKLSSEFVSAIIVGALIGYFLDRLAGTGPWGMIIFLLLGFCAGVLNVLRMAGKVSTPTVGDSKSDRK